MKKIRWGILACGRIAKKFAADLRYVENAELYALGSRRIEQAEAFNAEFPAKKIYGSYEELVADKDVDAIYIASPHGLHYEHVMLCLEHGKAVLCEKAFAINQRQVSNMIDYARANKVFLMEALWTKFLPHYKKTMSLLEEKKLGKLKSVLINFGFRPVAPVSPRLFEPQLGGGSLLDIGIYNVFMALSVLGRPDEIEATMTPARTGVDEQCAMLFKYKDGVVAQLFSSFSSNLATEADISGEEGRIRLTTRFYEPSAVIEYYPERIDSKQIIPVEKNEGWGYHHEIRHATECLQQGLTESPVMTHEDSLLLIETLDRIRAAAGIKYPHDSI